MGVVVISRRKIMIKAMENTTQVLILTSVLFSPFLIFITFIKRVSKKPLKLPPGPPPYPIIGNILEIGFNPLLSITNLSKTYGPIMSLKLGTRTTIVISSPEIVKEIYHKHDLDFSSRHFPDCARVLDHHKLSIAWLPISPQWRTLRRTCVTKLFSNIKLDSTQFLRQSKVGDLINHIHEYSIKAEAIDLAEAVFTTVLNSISNMFFSMDFACYGSDETHEYKKLVIGLGVEHGRPNVSDLFPILSFLDPQRIRARTRDYYGKLYDLFDDILEERLSFRCSNTESKEYNDVLDSLLDIIQDESSQLNRADVLHLFLDLFTAGTDTTSSTLEWAMTELLRNPKHMAKAKTELHQVIGKGMKLEESLISKLPFIQALIKETLRVHPPAPFLLPHKANFDVEFFGFLVPKNAQILINVWAMGKDPSIWHDPNLFLPERFLETDEIDFKGTNFEFIPFGSGRRMCPRLPLASRLLGFMLASLIYHFDWNLPGGLKPEDMDMSQNYGVTLHKAQPLKAVPIKV